MNKEQITDIIMDTYYQSRGRGQTMHTSASLAAERIIAALDAESTNQDAPTVPVDDEAEAQDDAARADALATFAAEQDAQRVTDEHNEDPHSGNVIAGTPDVFQMREAARDSE